LTVPVAALWSLNRDTAWLFARPSISARAKSQSSYASFVGALVGLGIPEYEAKRYEGRIKSGGILLSVHCDDSE
jgi:hypothetical protein